MEDLEIRPFEAGDWEALTDLYPAAFPEEDLLPLLDQLHHGDSDLVSLVAIRDNRLIGHVSFTICAIADSVQKNALLAPLAVHPDYQRQSVGSLLVREGFRLLNEQSIPQIQVLGDPAYYSRFGFAADDKLSPPYALPEEWRGAWQFYLLDEKNPQQQGKLVVPEAWNNPALWSA